MSQLSDALRAQRLAAGLTQEQVAAQIGLTRQAVSGYEAGRTQPDLDTLRTLAEVYGTDLSALLGDTPQETAPGEPRFLAPALALIALPLLVRSVLFLLAQRAYSLVGGGASKEQIGTHFALTRAAERLEGLSYFLLLLGGIVLLILCARHRAALTPKRGAVYFFAFAAALLACTYPFSLFEPTFHAIDYGLPALFQIGRAAVFFVVAVFLSKKKIP